MCGMANRLDAKTTWRSRIVGHGEEAPTSLVPNPQNWRTHPKAQHDALAAVLDGVGWVQDVIVNRQTGHIVDGHLRVDMAIARQEPTIPVVYVDITGEEERLILATLDPLAAMAVANKDMLKNLLQGLEGSANGVQGLLAQVAQQQKVVLEKAGLTDPDDVPEVPEEPVTKLGDLWRLGDHRLLCGDATNAEDVRRLLGEEKPLLMVTDPPYGVGYEVAGANPKFKRRPTGIANDDLGKGQAAFWQSAFAHWPLEGDAYIFSPPGPLITVLCASLVAAGIEHHQWLIWVKHHFSLGRAHYHYRHEHIFYGWKGRTSWDGSRDLDSVWEEDRPTRSPEHPTMKPVALCERAVVHSSRAGGLVVDPFLGSGTTIIAAEKLGRRCYGMEIEPCYVDVAVRRWEAFAGRQAELIPGTEAAVRGVCGSPDRVNPRLSV